MPKDSPSGFLLRAELSVYVASPTTLAALYIPAGDPNVHASQRSYIVVTSPVMSESGRRSRSVGTHHVEVDGDSLFITGCGLLTVDDIQQILDLSSQLKEKHHFVFLLYDGRQTTGIESGARKLVSKGKQDDWTTRLRVAFGLSFPMRVMINMILQAQRSLFNKEMYVHVFEHEHEAREFFENERDRIRKLVRLGQKP